MPLGNQESSKLSTEDEFRFVQIEAMPRINDENLSPIPLLHKCKPLSPFIAKLRILLQQQKYHEAIHWSPDGRSLVISDVDTFKDQVLETEDEMFKTKNFASFVRQLNLYGFKKLQTSNVKGDPTVDMHFEHPNFRKDRPDLIAQVQRTCNSMKRRSLASSFQDVYTPKRLRLEEQQSSVILSPLVELQNDPQSLYNEPSHRTNITHHYENNNTCLDRIGDDLNVDMRGLKTVQSQEHDYALPIFNISCHNDYDENRMYDYLTNHFQDEITVVQALLSMASQCHLS